MNSEKDFFSLSQAQARPTTQLSPSKWKPSARLSKFASPSALLPAASASVLLNGHLFANSLPHDAQHKPGHGATEQLQPISGSPNLSLPLTPPRGLGYFVFPPDGSPSIQSSVKNDDDELKDQLSEESKIDAAAAREKDQAEARKLQRIKENIEAEARCGEETWVRSGGILRDARGIRDWPRTEAMRAELKLRDWETAVTARWDAYEARWSPLLNSERKTGMQKVALRFKDIPWPIYIDGTSKSDQVRETMLADLTPPRVKDFLLEGLKVRGCNVTKKERVRSSLLRWHPDKMTGVLAMIIDEDVEEVKEGIRIVFECLQKLISNT